MKLAVTITTPNVVELVPLALLTGTFEQRLETAARLGYNGVELMVLRPDEVDVTTVRDQVAACGLEIAAVASGGIAAIDRLTLLAADDETRQRAVARLYGLIDCASMLEAPLVTVGGFRGWLGSVGAPDRRLQLIETLRQASEYAARRNVRLVFEPLNRYETDIVHTVAEGLQLIEEVDHSHLGLLLDTFHANIEEPSFDRCIRHAMAAGRLWHVHIADSNRLPPGGGHLDVAGIMATLRATGYQGYLSAELLARPDPDTAAAETIATMRRFVAD